ncbi:MAG: putative bifunctional diguanylate cyclase/phosphodiesterase [Lautropia sp.]
MKPARRAGSARRRAATAGPPSRATVMVVDADASAIDSLRGLLEAAGYSELLTTADPSRADQLLDAHSPDILLLDLAAPAAPGAGGFDVLRRLRAIERWRYLPVILMTARTDADARLRALELGATDILAKPVDASELALRLRNALGIKAYQDRLRKLDALTGLANRAEFIDRVDRLLREPGQHAVARTLMLLDVDRFKHVNDSLGHEAGDELLRGVATRLAEVVVTFGGTGKRAEDLNATPWLARMNSDKFMALLPGETGEERHEQCMRAIVDCFDRPFRVAGRDLLVSASIGLARYPLHGERASALTQRAELAVKQSKRQGTNRVTVYSELIGTHATGRLAMEQALRHALARGELRVFFQPKVASRDLRICGVEALVRWQHPDRGLLAPAHFIPIAEETGLIAPIGRWVLEASCRQIAAWDAKRLPAIALAVNVSATQFARADVCAIVADAIAGSGLDASRLTIELTETTLIGGSDDTAAQLQALAALGVRLSLDDFGTGYSSLTYLRRFPIAEIKIDRAFVAGLPASRDNVAIVNAILALGRELGLRVVAEGVETDAEMTHLRERGCDQLQGSLFGGAADADALGRMLHAMR